MKRSQESASEADEDSQGNPLMSLNHQICARPQSDHRDEVLAQFIDAFQLVTRLADLLKGTLLGWSKRRRRV